MLFVFQSSRHHRHLHSFPTRRSSDLNAARDRLRNMVAAFDAGDVMYRQTDTLSRGQQQKVLLMAALLRSEEHTSELQSRVDLVCRLLLEKKKNNSNIEIRGL